MATNTNHKFLPRDSPTQAQSLKAVWDRLHKEYKDTLRTQHQVFIYNRNEEKNFIDGFLNIKVESSIMLEYFYLSQSREKQSVDILRLHQNNCIVQKDKALMALNLDKTIKTDFKTKARSDLVILLKEEEATDIFIVFRTREDLSDWLSSLEALFDLWDESQRVGQPMSPSNQQYNQIKTPKRDMNSLGDSEPYYSTSNSNTQSKPKMKLDRIMPETSDSGPRLTLRLSMSSTTENNRTQTVQILRKRYNQNPEACLQQVTAELNSLSAVDIHLVTECISDTMKYDGLKDRSAEVTDLVEHALRSTNDDADQAETLNDISKRLKVLQTQHSKLQSDKNADMITRLHSMMMNARLGYMVENYETIAYLEDQKEHDQSYISNTPGYREEDEDDPDEGFSKRLIGKKTMVT